MFMRSVERKMPCLVGEFLLCTGEPCFADARIVEFIDSLTRGENLVLMILDENFQGLDTLSKESHLFHGSPLLLFIWLPNHLSLLPRPDMSNYGSKDYKSRKITEVGCMIEEGWTYHNIRWECNWWRCGSGPQDVTISFWWE